MTNIEIVQRLAEGKKVREISEESGLTIPCIQERIRALKKQQSPNGKVKNTTHLVYCYARKNLLKLNL